MNIKKSFHPVLAGTVQTEDVVASYWLLRVSALRIVTAVVFTLSMSVATTGWTQQSEAQIAAYIEQLDASDDKKQSQAIAALVAMGATAVPQLIGTLTDPRFSFHAVEVLSQIGPVAIDALKQALRDPHENIRVGAANVLVNLGYRAESAVPDLIAALKDNKESVRRAVASTLAQVVGPGSGAAVNDLVAALKDPDDVVRGAAALALGRIGPAASAASDALIEVLKEDNKSAVNAAGALGQIRGYTKATVPALIEALNRNDVMVRINAAYALGQLGLDKKESIPALTKALKHSDPMLRRAAAQALSYFGPGAGSAVRDLMHALLDRDAGVLQNAVAALGGIGPAAAPAVHYLKHWLNKGNIELRRRAAWALGNIGPLAKAAIPSLKDARIHDDPQLRREAYLALLRIVPPGKQFIGILVEVKKSKDDILFAEVGTSLGQTIYQMTYASTKVLAERAIEAMSSGDNDVQETGAMTLLIASVVFQRHLDRFSTLELRQIVLGLEQAEEFRQKEIAEMGRAAVESFAGARRALNAELTLRESRSVEWMLKLITENKWESGIAIVLIFVLSVTLLILGLRPLWLLRINETLKPYTDFTLPDWLGGMKLPIRAVFMVGFFHYHRRVLDAWVAAHIDSVRDKFAKRRTVVAREVNISVPVIVDGNTVADFSGESLKSSFVRQRTCLLIWGEGGSGKTSLACQVARWVMSEDAHQRPCEKHRMLPVLIEQDLRGETFLEAVRGQLQDLVDEPEPIPMELLERLLRNRRILVIVDHFSEMNETTRGQIRPELSEFAANALIVTSRVEEWPRQVSRTTIKPLRIAGNRLSSFMEAYLSQCGKRDLFSDPEFFDACSRLSAMVGTRDLTILFAKLYADQLIATKEHLANLPNNIPDLVLNYLNELNRNGPEKRFDDRAVHRDAKIIAWECLRRTFRPISARVTDALAALAELGADNAQARLEYIEHRLGLIQTIQPSQDQFRFLLDPLAEYLAAMYVVESYNGIGRQWQDFLDQANSEPRGAGTIASFLLSVQDYCRVKSKETNIPTFVYQKLAEACNQQA